MPIAREDIEALRREKYGGALDANMHDDLARLARGEPLAYIIGTQPFLDVSVVLKSRPLIPRPETEWWTEELIKTLQSFPNPCPTPRSPSHSKCIIYDTDTSGDADSGKDAGASADAGADVSVSTGLSAGDGADDGHSSIYGGGEKARIDVLDLCAGSGAIGLALLKHVPQAHVVFSDIEEAHVSDIRESIRTNNLDAARATMHTGDLFAPLSDMRFDIIATNPPYVPEKRKLPESVTGYEPHRALFGGADGSEYIQRILKEAPHYLKRPGQLWLECDIEHSADLPELAKKHGACEAEIRTDLYGRPRLLVAYYR